jgi:ribosomal protein L24
MQSSQSVKVTKGHHKGRAGRVLSAGPYMNGEGKAAVSAVDVQLDADPHRPAEVVALPVDDLELLG